MIEFNLQGDLLKEKPYTFPNVSLLFAQIIINPKTFHEKEWMYFMGKWKEIVAEFDEICVKNKVFKIYSKNDLIYALIWLHNSQTGERNAHEEANNVVNVAYEMLDFMKKYQRVEMLSINIKIVIHSVFFYFFPKK